MNERIRQPSFPTMLDQTVTEIGRVAAEALGLADAEELLQFAGASSSVPCAALVIQVADELASMADGQVRPSRADYILEARRRMESLIASVQNIVDALDQAIGP